MPQIVLTSGTSWTVPADCIAATVECIGGGQGGNASNGGAGGDYAKTSVSLTPGASVSIGIGAAGAGVTSGAQNAGGDTTFGAAVLARGGGSGSTDVGSTTYAGGAGNASGAGGGAAGPNGAGSAASGTTGGQGDGTHGGAGGAAGSAGSAGTEWGTVGSGGGGGSAPAWLSLISTTTKVNPSYSTTLVFATGSATQVGDTVILGLDCFYGYSARPYTVTDDAGNTWTRVASQFSASAKQQDCWMMTVAAGKTSAACTVTVTWTSSEYALGTVWQARGSALALDSAHDIYYQDSTSAPGTTARNLGTLNTSAPALVLLIGGTYTSGAYALALGASTPFSTDAAGNCSTTYGLMAHRLSTAAITGDAETMSVPGQSANISIGAMIVPLIAS